MQWWQEMFVYISATSGAGRTGEGGESCPFNYVVSTAPPPVFVVFGLLSTVLCAASLWQRREAHPTEACQCLHWLYGRGVEYYTGRCLMQQMMHGCNKQCAEKGPAKINSKGAMTAYSMWAECFLLYVCHLQHSTCVRGGNGITEQIWVTAFK